MWKKDARPQLTMRAASIPDDLYEYIKQRIGENGTFRAYALDLVRRDRMQHLLIGDEIQQLQSVIEETIKRENDQLLRQINERLLNVNFVGVNSEKDDYKKFDITKEEKLLDINVETRGELNKSELDADF